MTKTVKIPGPDHPITVEPTGRRVVVKAAGRVIADTQNALTLQEASYPAVQYVPLSAVDPSALERTDNESYCPYKGDASYYSVLTASGTLENAVWTYEHPYDAVSQIAGHVAFYTDRVDVTVD